MTDFLQTKELPQIKADYYIPVGEACRPAYWLQKYGLRRCALPFDWMMNYDLKTVCHTVKNGVGGWFSEYDEDLCWQGKMRKVEDKRTSMISLHHFSRDKSVEEQKKDILKIFKRRCKRMKKILSDGKRVCFVCNRTDARERLLSFIAEMAAMFPHTRFVLINVRHDEKNCEVYYKQISRRLSFYEICGADKHEKGSTPENPLFWLGNEQLWNAVCRRLILRPAKNKREFYFFGIKITF